MSPDASAAVTRAGPLPAGAAEDPQSAADLAASPSGGATRTASAHGYLACRTCGRFLQAQDLVAGRFCSEQCTVTFHRCTVCGSFFARDEGYRAHVCSAACHERFEIRLPRYLERALDSMEEVV